VLGEQLMGGRVLRMPACPSATLAGIRSSWNLVGPLDHVGHPPGPALGEHDVGFGKRSKMPLRKPVDAGPFIEFIPSSATITAAGCVVGRGWISR